MEKTAREKTIDFIKMYEIAESQRVLFLRDYISLKTLLFVHSAYISLSHNYPNEKKQQSCEFEVSECDKALIKSKVQKQLDLYHITECPEIFDNLGNIIELEEMILTIICRISKEK